MLAVDTDLRSQKCECPRTRFAKVALGHRGKSCISRQHIFVAEKRALVATVLPAVAVTVISPEYFTVPVIEEPVRNAISSGIASSSSTLHMLLYTVLCTAIQSVYCLKYCALQYSLCYCTQYCALQCSLCYCI